MQNQQDFIFYFLTERSAFLTKQAYDLLWPRAQLADSVLTLLSEDKQLTLKHGVKDYRMSSLVKEEAYPLATKLHCEADALDHQVRLQGFKVLRILKPLWQKTEVFIFDLNPIFGKLWVVFTHDSMQRKHKHFPS